MDVRHRLTSVFVGAVLMALTPVVIGAMEVRLEARTEIAPPSGELIVRSGTSPDRETAHPLADRLQLATAQQGDVVTCRGERLWCPEVRLAGDSITLPVFAAMTVTAEIGGPSAAAVAEGAVQGLVRSEGGGEEVELRETVALDGTKLSFTAPLAILDLRLAFPGAAPIYRWGVEPPPSVAGEPVTLDLGKLTLQAGGSLSGWVRSREDEMPLPNADVAAVPLTAGAGDPPLHISKAQTNDRGFFQIDSLQPGSYRVTIAEEGRVPRVLEPVAIEQAAETLVGTVLLDAPIRLAVAVDPPRHPDGSPWTLQLTPVRRLPGEEPARAKVAEEGIGELTGLRPGDYYVQVQDARGDELAFETRSIQGDGWLTIEVPIVEVRGSVSLGDEPIAAAVLLETGAGDRVELESGEEGELAGWMRQPERSWLIATVRWFEGRERRQRTLDVVPTLDDGILELEIDLPAGTVYGDVVDADGKPQPRFRVRATPAEGASRLTAVQGRTDASGRFHLTGLDAAAYLLQAGGNGSPASETVRVELGGDLPIGDVRLVVWPTRQVTMAVTAAGQGVAGASVSLHGLGRVPVSLQDTTDAQGEAAFDVPESTERAVVTVTAPSHLLWSGCVPLADDRIALALPPLPAGSISLVLVGRGDLPPTIDGQSVVLTGDGGFLTYQELIHWNRRRNAEQTLTNEDVRQVHVLELPALPPGSYAATWSSAPPWELAARACAGAGAFPSLEWVTLSPGGEAQLRLDVSNVQTQRLRNKSTGESGR